MSISEWSDDLALRCADPRHQQEMGAEIVRLRGELRAFGEFKCSCAERDALAAQVRLTEAQVEALNQEAKRAISDRDVALSQVAALRAAMEWASKQATGRLPDWWHAALADSSKAAETFTAEIRAEEKAKWETAKADLVMKAAALGADLAMGGGPAHDAAIRKAALISAAEHFDSDYWQYVTLSAHTVVVALQKLAEAK